jgi:hypothetical protein
VTKYKIKGKVYNFLENCEVVDEDVITFKKIIEDSKHEKFQLIHSKYSNDYHLYDMKNKRLSSFDNLKEM